MVQVGLAMVNRKQNTLDFRKKPFNPKEYFPRKKHVKINATQPLLLGKSIDLPYNRPDIFGSGKISVDLGLAGGERGWGRVCPAPQCTGLISLSRNTKERVGIRS